MIDAIGRVGLDLLGDAVHRRDRLDRILPGRGFRRQHHGVGAFEDRGRDVGHLGARRHRIGDHRFQHLRRDHHRLAGAARGARDLLLDAGHFLERHLDAEIAARDHQRVGEVHDLGEARHRLRLLDLGHHGRAAARDLLGLRDVLRPLDERQRDPVDAGIEAGFEVGAVLLGQRREADRGVGQAHALARRELAADLDARDGALRRRSRSRRKLTLPSSSSSVWPGSSAARISGCGR